MIAVINELIIAALAIVLITLATAQQLLAVEVITSAPTAVAVELSYLFDSANYLAVAAFDFLKGFSCVIIAILLFP